MPNLQNKSAIVTGAGSESEPRSPAGDDLVRSIRDEGGKAAAFEAHSALTEAAKWAVAISSGVSAAWSTTPELPT